MITLIDIGNTTYHILDDNKDFKIKIEDKLPTLDNQIYFISVNEEATKKLLNKYVDAIDIGSWFKVDTNYSSTLGIDRVAVCSYIKDGIIVDCGSAITVDIMKNNKHLGGFIMPNISRLKSIYPAISKKLEFNFEKQIDLDKIPLDTNSAINYSILNMIILPIKNIQIQYDMDIIFTGENSTLIMEHFKNSSFQKSLIFDAMKRVIREYI